MNQQINPPIAIVAGMSKKNRAIGIQNQLIWHVSDDLKSFSAITRGKPVIMGRKTFESILVINGSPLAERENIIVTRNMSYFHDTATICHSLEEALDTACKLKPEEIHIGSGSELYMQALPQVSRLYLTYFDDEQLADSFFPEFAPEFRETERHGIREFNGLTYEWVDLVRRS